MKIIFILQILVSVIYVVNKMMVLAENKKGWLLGAIAACLAVIYFSLLGLFVYTALNVGLIILMGYGYIKGKEKSPKVEAFIRSVTIVTMIAFAFFAWSGTITAVELASSLGLIVGTFFLTHEKPLLGWLLYTVGHITAIYLGCCKGQMFFAVCQLMSVIISIFGAMKVAGLIKITNSTKAST